MAETLADIIVTERIVEIFDNDCFEIERKRGMEQKFVSLEEIKSALLKCKQVENAEIRSLLIPSGDYEDILYIQYR